MFDSFDFYLLGTGGMFSLAVPFFFPALGENKCRFSPDLLILPEAVCVEVCLPAGRVDRRLHPFRRPPLLVVSPWPSPFARTCHSASLTCILGQPLIGLPLLVERHIPA